MSFVQKMVCVNEVQSVAQAQVPTLKKEKEHASSLLGDVRLAFNSGLTRVKFWLQISMRTNYELACLASLNFFQSKELVETCVISLTLKIV